MAFKDSKIVQLAYELVDKFTGKVGRVVSSIRKVDSASEKSASKIERSNERASKSFSLLASGAGKVFAIISALTVGAVAAISRWTKAAAIQERAEVKLATTLRNLTGASNDQIQALKEQAAALQQVTGYGDEQIISAQAMLGTFQLNSAQIQDLTPRLLDMAEASRKAGSDQVDLETISIALGKAFSTGIGSLSRYGIAMTEAQKAAFSLADQQGKVQLLAEILDGNFQGLAEAVGKSYEGGVRKADAAQGDFQETLGAQFTQNKQFIKLQGALQKTWEQLSAGITGSSKEIAAIVSYMSRVVIGAFGGIRAAWNVLQIVFKSGAVVILGAIRAIVLGLESITFGNVSEAFRLMKDDLDKYGAELIRGMEGDAGDISDAAKTMGNAFLGVADDVADASGKVNDTVGKKGLSGNLAEAEKAGTKELQSVLETQAQLWYDYNDRLNNTKTDQESIAEEFAKVSREALQGKDATADPLQELVKKFNAAKQSLEQGNSDLAISQAREAAAIIRTMTDDANGASNYVTGLAREVERVANAAAQAKADSAQTGFDALQQQVTTLSQQISGNEQPKIEPVIDLTQAVQKAQAELANMTPLGVNVTPLINGAVIRAALQKQISRAISDAAAQRGSKR